MKANKSIDEQKSDDSFDYDFDKVNRSDSIKSDDIDELIRNTDREIDKGII